MKETYELDDSITMDSMWSDVEPILKEKQKDEANGRDQNPDPRRSGQSRGRDVVNARQIAMYLIRRMTNLSLNDIGKAFGDRDHTTVLHSLDKVEKQMRSDPAFAETVKEITTNINAKQ